MELAIDEKALVLSGAERSMFACLDLRFAIL